METVSISQVKRDISELVNRVAYGGERIILTSRGHPKAVLISLADLEQLQNLSQAISSDIRAQRLATLERARTIRSQIAARVGSILPDSAQELQGLREERDAELLRLR
jgi:prevent-host-death family protein